MDAALVIALVAIALLAGELLLSTGGALAAIGATGLVVAGIVALSSDSGAGDIVGPALIVLGILSLIACYFVTRKVLEAHRDEPVRTGSEELIGEIAEARSDIDPEGQVWTAGTVWGARLANGAGEVRLGDRVVVDAVDGLTLVVRPEASPTTEEGAS